MAKQEILQVIKCDPQVKGYSQSRWTLKALADCLDWLKLTTAAGWSSLLKRLGISDKRGRDYIHSPDRHYFDKLSQIELALLRAWYEPEHYVFLYLDEFSFYRQPTLAQDWAPKGQIQPLARQSHSSNNLSRGAAALNALSGQVTYLLRSEINVTVLVKLYEDIRTDYPDAAEIYVVQDNWPVHFHPTVLSRLQQQQWSFTPKLPASWSGLPPPVLCDNPLPIRLLNLPTYASWLNPIEKLWRWVRQQVLHLHRHSDDWPTLKQRVDDFFSSFRQGSTDLLRYVGLLPN